MATNPELELAHRFVTETNRNVYLTGKAGTGKTTFLHRIRRECPKRAAVVAPTGVAAINARGMTIHSLFQLPFGVLSPPRLREEMGQRRFNRRKVDLFRGLDLLIIDEISMVRADVLDAIDHVLRKFRGSTAAFGGVQVLMIGDLHQLAPVVRDGSESALREHYATPYFFSSHVLARARPRVVQLTHIFRQADRDFIDLLNAVREDRLTAAQLATLNGRYRPDFTADPAAGYITLTSHNHLADGINAERLAALTSPAHRFRAAVTGKFPESMYPNRPELEFRVGARVMFNRNDTGEQRDYYNGKLATITAIDGDEIGVLCDDGVPLTVVPVAWTNTTYVLDPETKVVEEETVGSYEQHPLRLAWAITIHKSQGLTFDRVVIDAGRAFAPGQVYVALSRCRTFEGIVLRSRIEDHSVRTDGLVNDYSRAAADRPPTATDLREDRRTYQLDCLRGLFDFKEVHAAGRRLRRLLLEHERLLQGDPVPRIDAILAALEQRALAVGTNFTRQLAAYADRPELPADQPALAERLRGAATYFGAYLKDELSPALAALTVNADNRKVEQRVNDRYRDFARAIFVKERTFATLTEGFSTTAYTRARADAAIDFDRLARTAPARRIDPATVAHRELYLALIEWRRTVADATSRPAYTVLPNGVLLDIAERLPTDRRALLALAGFGRLRYERHGADLLALVAAYRAEHPAARPAAAPPPAASPTRQQTLELHRQGLDIAAIAARRELAETTVAAHLVHWIGAGEVAAAAVVEPERMEKIRAFMTEQPDLPLSGVFKHFEAAYSYPELRATAAVMDREIAAAD